MAHLLRVDEADQDALVDQVLTSSVPSYPYYIRLVLATLIASLGLVSGSTATVIGAMILAPLYGPLAGLALTSVRADTRHFYRALGAEWTGVLLTVVTSCLLALVIGAENIDFTQGEITGRIRPTLFDLGIGLFAGLAGAYASVRPQVSEGAAGVAIAVALVPPLAVTGLTAAGAMRGEVEWSWVWGSFMLFFANFLTIVVACAAVYWLAGLGRLPAPEDLRDLRLKTLGLGVLLLFTTFFLYSQLQGLFYERKLHRSATAALRRELDMIPGAFLEDLEVTVEGGRARMSATVSSSKPLPPSAASRLQAAIERRIPDLPLDLVVKTFQSSVVTPRGLVVDRGGASENRGLLQLLEETLQDAARFYPGAEIEGFRVLSQAPLELEVSIKGPWEEVSALDVRALERQLDYVLKQRRSGLGRVKIRLRITRVREVDGRGEVNRESRDSLSADEVYRYQGLAAEALGPLFGEAGGSLLGVFVAGSGTLGRTEDGRDLLLLQLICLADDVDDPPEKDLERWEEIASQALSDEDRQVTLVLSVLPPDQGGLELAALRTEDARRWILGLTIALREAAYRSGGDLRGTPEAVVLETPSGDRPGVILVRAVITSVKPLQDSDVDKWERRLTEQMKGLGENYRVELIVDNRLGRFLGP